MTLKLINNVSKKEYEFNVTDENDSVLYYHFENFVLEDNMDDGEYNYFLYDDDKLVAQGLLQVGDYASEHKTYENKTKTEYKQYGKQ